MIPAMPRALVLQHVPAEGPGRIADALAIAGYAVEVRHLHASMAVPEELGEEEILVVMGGPMGVNEADMIRHPFLAGEIVLLRRAIAANQPVLGICLGAQLLAHAAGGRVHRNMQGGTWVREVGWDSVAFHGVARHPELAGMPRSEVMLHWHGDTFDLPEGATLLASSERCRNQAFRLNHRGRPGRQIGLQFHCEVDVPTIRDWLRQDAEYVADALGAGGHERVLSDSARYEGRHRQVAGRLLGNMVGILARS